MDYSKIISPFRANAAQCNTKSSKILSPYILDDKSMRKDNHMKSILASFSKKSRSSKSLCCSGNIQTLSTEPEEKCCAKRPMADSNQRENSPYVVKITCLPDIYKDIAITSTSQRIKTPKKIFSILNKIPSFTEDKSVKNIQNIKINKENDYLSMPIKSDLRKSTESKLISGLINSKKKKLHSKS